MKPLRVVLADDHTLVRAGIRSLLERIPGIEVVGEADTGLEALALIGAHQPDVVLIDIGMPGLDGLGVATRVARDWPRVRVIILSMHANEEYVAQALRAGAVGYLLKDSATAELDLAFEALCRGDTYLSPSISRAVIDGYLARHAGAGRRTESVLTPRQREILSLVAGGSSTKEIAGMLSLSAKTVDTHRAQLMDRLNIYDVPGLVRYALHLGLIPPVN
jgi:DNA-binding NarL/FixJ family response regulator